MGEHRVRGGYLSSESGYYWGDLLVGGVVLVVIFLYCSFLFSFVEVYLGKIKIWVLFSFIFSRYSFLVSPFYESGKGTHWGVYFLILPFALQRF